MFSPNHGERRYMLFDNSLFFIPEYMVKALKESGFTITDYVGKFRDLLNSAKEEGFDRSYKFHNGGVLEIAFEEYTNDTNNISENIKSICNEITAMNNKLLEKVGRYELENLYYLQVALMDRLKLKPYERMDEQDEEISEVIFFNGIKNVLSAPCRDDDRYGNILNILKGKESIPFNETFEIVDDSATFIIVKEGFSNYLNVQGRYEFLKQLVDAKEKTVGDRIYSSYLIKGLIKEKLSN